MVKIFSVVNLSQESPQKDSLVNSPQEAIQKMLALQKLGADYVDLGARSSFSKSNELNDQAEAERLELFFSTPRPKDLISISLDTWSDINACRYLNQLDVLNYTSTNFPDSLLGELARTGCPLVINYLPAANPYALRKISYRPPSIKAIMEYFVTVVPYLKSKGVNILAVDPNLGMWHPETPDEQKPLFQREIIEIIPELKKIAPIFIVAPRTNGMLNTHLAELILSKGVDYVRTHDVVALKDIVGRTT